jgi:hypothetical protein
MNTKLLSEKALTVIDQYLHFKIGGATISIPYYNNRHKQTRAALRALIGKGSPRDIHDEVEIILVKEGGAGAISGNIKEFLVDHDIGIDCSGFAYYVLSAESLARGKGSLDRHLKFPLAKSLIRKFLAKIRPAENISVATLAHDKNSYIVPMKEVQPGDMITMMSPDVNSGVISAGRDHILVISQVEYQNFIPTTIHYVHSVAWPTDGEYGHGVRVGQIDILDPEKSILEQNWSEKDALERGKNSRTEIRRLRSF